ncbi:MAG TPA: trimeric intracellular cation channel family protein [Phycisphaerales bacterium]|nr:trimeric intracellular cation channel family protein [Phycisphaerales bacterium]
MSVTTGIVLGAATYWITQTAVAVSAASGVLEAGRKRFDLFGMVIVGLAAAIGGGSVRDLLLDRPVFWVQDQTYLIVAIVTALLIFFLARRIPLPPRLFLVPDALGLALYTVVGTKVALAMGTPGLVASFMGVITGVVGGILRDVLCNEEPVVFQGTLYATLAWGGALALIGFYLLPLSTPWPELLAGGLIFLGRLVAMRWQIGLPKFHAR